MTTLAEGVRQIRDGNLGHRIAHAQRDEFQPVCEAFNEMADRLRASVEQSRREEEGRKELLASISHDVRSPLTSIRAYVEGLLDGTIDMIATDHAPHTAEEKSGGLERSLMGVVGLETAFPALYTGLVEPGILPLEKLIALLADKPRARFGLSARQDVCIWDLAADYEIDPAEFLSRGRSTPFAGMRVRGSCLMTIYGGKVVWRKN